MATTTSHLSVEEFHRLYDDASKPYYEYWYGEAIQKSMPTWLHGIVQFAIMLLLRDRGWRPSSEVRLRIRPEAEPVPDVIATRQTPQQPYPTQPVEICIEILSPDDRLQKVIEKGKRYLSWGIQYVWIIDPVARTAWMLTHEHPDGVWIHPEDKLSASEATEIPLLELFAEVDRLIS